MTKGSPKPYHKLYHFDAPAVYKICVHGSLDPQWSERLEGMSISIMESADLHSVTTLEGNLLDQAALSGVLNTLYDLHLPVLSVERVSSDLE